LISRAERIAIEKDKAEEEIKSDEADVTYARHEINSWIKAGFLRHGSDWVQAWWELGLKFNDGTKSMVTLPAHKLEEFVERARANAEVFELAKYFAALRLAQGLPLPGGIGVLMAEYLRGEFSTPPVRRGRKPDTWARDFIIADTMHILGNRWDHRCRNRRKDSKKCRKSISQIVHDALQCTEIGLVDVDSIQKIYSRAQKNGTRQKTFGIYIVSQFDDYIDDDANRTGEARLAPRV
jgi:hypothetical protein